MDAQFRYDEASDALHLAFGPARSATGVALHEDLLLRMDEAAREPVGVTIFNFSRLAEQEERCLPLRGLSQLDESMRGLALQIMLGPAVSRYLRVQGNSVVIPPFHVLPA
jgi:uncharacterized protein YuzE